MAPKVETKILEGMTAIDLMMLVGPIFEGSLKMLYQELYQKIPTAESELGMVNAAASMNEVVKMFDDLREEYFGAIKQAADSGLKVKPSVGEMYKVVGFALELREDIIQRALKEFKELPAEEKGQFMLDLLALANMRPEDCDCEDCRREKEKKDD